MLALTRKYGLSEKRDEYRLLREDLIFKCVEIDGIRLYLVYFPRVKVKGVSDAWQEPGIGLPMRLAESLLPHVDSASEIECNWENPPAPSYVPEGPSHERLRERICGLLHRAAIDPEKIKVTSRDVYLYPTGMAAIYYLDRLAARYRPGSVVVLGSVFHNTFHLLRNRAGPSEFKHFPQVDTSGLDSFETWLREETDAGRDVSYAIVEFPSNPILVSADLHRLHALSRKYNFIFAVDDTIGSFANVDVLPTCDVLVTSITKTFSGYADVMGGSTVLNPLSPHYSGDGGLRALYDAEFHNEVFTGDVDTLLANSEDYLSRSAKLGQNATLLAAHLQTASLSPSSPILRVHHPSVVPSGGNYTSLYRRPTPEYPSPTYPCLLSVDFASLEATRAFYDALAFYPGPHLGAHKSLSLCYGALLFGKDEEEKKYQAGFGVFQEAVRISVGLEEWEDLRDTVDVAIKAAAEVGGRTGV